MSCLESNQKYISSQIDRGILPTSAEKDVMISAMLKNDPDLLAEVIQMFDVRMSVFRDADGNYTYDESSKSKLEDRLNLPDDPEQHLLEQKGNQSFATEESKHKIATTQMVNAIISSIPFIQEIPSVNELGTTKYSYTRTLPITKTRQLLYNIYAKKGLVASSDKLQPILLREIQSNTHSDNDKRILVSLYNYLYSPIDLEYRDIQGKSKIFQSLSKIAEVSSSPEIKTRVQNYLNVFHGAIISVNDFSSLMILTQDGNFVKTSDDKLVYRMNINSIQANNIFDTVETSDSIELSIKNEIAKSFKDNNIGVISNGETTNVTFKIGDSIINIPFEITDNKEKIVKVEKIYDKYLKELSERYSDTLSESKAREKAVQDIKNSLANVDVIYNILNQIGYKGIVNKQVINHVLNTSDLNKEDAEKKFRQNLDSLWQLVASGIVGISIKLQQDQARTKSDTHQYIPYHISQAIQQKIEEAYKNIGFEERPFNIKKTIDKSSLYEEGLDAKKFESSVISPIGFWKNNDWLAQQIMDSGELFKRQAQYNVDGERVDVNNVASRAELITKFFADINSLIEGGAYTVFKNNPFANKKWVVEGIGRVNGYKNTEERSGKSQMSMNELEIARTHYAVYLNDLIDNYNKVDNKAPVVSVIPQVYSDKSFWASFKIRTSDHNFLPLTQEGKIDIPYLLKKDVANQIQLDRDFTINFINEWNKMYYTDIITGQREEFLKDTEKGNPEELLANPEKLESWLKNLDSKKLTYLAPISGTQFKYYNVTKNADKTFTIAPSEIVKNKVLKIKWTVEDYQREALGKLAYNHNKLKTIGFDSDAKGSFNEQLKEKAKSVIPNIQFGKETTLDLTNFFEAENNIPKKDKFGEPIINKSKSVNEQIALLQDLNPIEVSLFFAHNLTYNHINDVLLGSRYQYKDKINKKDESSQNAMLADMLKRSVNAASPGVAMSLDENTPRKKGDLRIPRLSKTLFVRDEQAIGEILGAGEIGSVDVFDGGSFTTRLAEIMYQTSFGGVHGLMPNSSLKFFYSNTNTSNGDNKLVKYASHVITEEQLNIGTQRLWNLLKLQLGGLPLNRDIQIPPVKYNGENIIEATSFSSEQSLFDVFMYIKQAKDQVVPSLDTFAILADIIKENPDLKDRFIHQLIIESSNKDGKQLFHEFKNIEPRIQANHKFTEDELVILDNSGLVMQLDATHSPDDSTVSKFSQAITNSIIEGRTLHLAEELLETLGKLVRTNLSYIKKVFEDGEFDFENEFSITQLKLNTIPQFKEYYTQGLTEEKLEKVLISKFNSLDKTERVKLFIRAIVMDSMEQQNNINSTYKELESNEYSLQSPQTASLIESGIRAYINRKTVAMKFSGGNYILSPSHGLFEVYEIEKDGVKSTVVGKPALERALTNGWTSIGQPRDLKWKGITKDGKSIFDTPVWKNYLADQNLFNKQALQKELETGGWEISPAEVLLPFSYKRRFNVTKGMQPSDVTLEYYEKLYGINNYFKKLNQRIASLPESARDAYLLKVGNYFLDRRRKANKNLKAGDKYFNFVNSVFNVNRILNLAEKFDVETISNLLSVEEDIVNSVLEDFKNYISKLEDKIKLDIETEPELLEIKQKALNKYNSFQKSLEVLVGRIPSTGMQSIVPAKIVGFIESNQNSIWFPKELMMIQGADLDIDKAVVLSWNFNDEGLLIEDESPEGLQNKIVQKQWEVAIHPANQIASDTPVGLDPLKTEKSTRENKNPDPFKADERMYFTMIMQKVLASEGKSMVGVVMNIYKTYNLLYYVHRKNRILGDNSTVKPLTVTGIDPNGETVPLTLQDLANIDPEKVETQMWEFFSMLGNAATDNAKEMILGAIKANLQTGNIIGLLTCYGVKQQQIFDLLAAPEIQDVLYRIRHSTDIGNDAQVPLDIETAIKQIFNERKIDFDKFVKGEKNGVTEREFRLYDSFLKLDKAAKELALLSGALGINRELPVSAYDRFNYAQKLENFINEKLEGDNFNFKRFVDPNQGDYKNYWKNRYNSIQESFNILKVLDEVPDINAYLQSYLFTDNLIKSLNDKYEITENIIKQFKEMYPTNQFNNITDNEYNSVIRYLEELIVVKYLRTNDQFQVLTTYNNGQKFDFSIHDNAQVSQFQIMFADFVQELKEEKMNTIFNKNKFFSSLQLNIDKNGKYLRIPNIDDLSPVEQFEMQSALNNYNKDLVYKGQRIKFEDFKKMLFAYALINSKGKVSTTSFFDLLDPAYKAPFDYIKWLNINPNLLSKFRINKSWIRQSAHINSALGNLLPKNTKDNKFFSDLMEQDETGQNIRKDKTSYLANTSVDSLPPFVSHRFKGKSYVYKLHKIQNNLGVGELRYSIIKPLYKPTTLTVSDNLSELTHITARNIYKAVYNSDKIAEMNNSSEGNVVPLDIRTEGNYSSDLNVYTNVGEFVYNPSKKVIKGKCKG